MREYVLNDENWEKISFILGMICLIGSLIAILAVVLDMVEYAANNIMDGFYPEIYVNSGAIREPIRIPIHSGE